MHTQRITKIAIISAAPIALLIWVVIGFAVISAMRPAQVVQSDAPAVVVKQTPPTADELLRLVNEERAKVGVAPLRMVPELNGSAQLKADDMLRSNLNSHTDANGKHGYEYAREAIPDRSVCPKPGENLSFSSDPTYHHTDAKSSVDGWMSSKAHKNAMLNGKYTITGFGIAGDKVVEHFC